MDLQISCRESGIDPSRPVGPGFDSSTQQKFQLMPRCRDAEMPRHQEDSTRHYYVASQQQQASSTPIMSSTGGASATARTPLRKNGAGRLSAAAAAAAAAAAKNNDTTAAAEPEPPMPPDHYPATVYRYTKTRGWERYRASTPQFARRRLLAAAGQRQGGVSGEQEAQSSQAVCAVPRRGCVEVRALRLRIRLFAEEDPNDDGGENGNSSGSGSGSGNHHGGSAASDEGIASGGSGRENTLVIRRSSRVLLSSRRNLGAIVLKFRSVSMAVDFCSRLVELNAPPSDGGTTLANCLGIGSTIGGGSLMSDPMSLSGPPSLSVADDMATTVPASGFGAAPPLFGGIGPTCASTGQEEQQADMATYMVRLLHDPSFLSFVNSMENSLANSIAGGELMLKALAMSSANAPAAPIAATAVAGRADGGST